MKNNCGLVTDYDSLNRRSLESSGCESTFIAQNRSQAFK